MVIRILTAFCVFTVALFLSVTDYQFQSLPRLFATVTGSIGDWTNHRSYAGFDAAFPGERGGSNDSSDENFFSGQGQNSWFDLDFRSLLPTGDGHDTLINAFVLNRGIIKSGEVDVTAWQPSVSKHIATFRFVATR